MLNSAYKQVVESMELWGLKPYLHKKAASGSIYVKSGVGGLGSVRIGDHEGRGKYTYKWNVRLDYKEVREVIDRGVVRRHYPATHINQMVSDMKDSMCGRSVLKDRAARRASEK